MKRKLIILWGLAASIVLLWGSVVCGNTVKIFYSDGVIQQGESYERVEVYDTPPSHTVVDIYGRIEQELLTYDASMVNFLGGEVNGYLEACETSVINIYTGMVFPRLSINAFYLCDSSTANVFGGLVGAVTLAEGSSTVNVYGGWMNHLAAYDFSTVNVYGGDIGHGWGFQVVPSATVNIYGYDFSYNPQAWWDGTGHISYGWVSELTGYGPEGVPIKITGMPDPATNPNIHLIPEPATVLLLGLGGFCLLKNMQGNSFTRQRIYTFTLLGTKAPAASDTAKSPAQ